MASSSRTAQLARLHKILKKHYKPVSPNPDRPVLEQMLFACCLENAHHDAAEEAYAAVVDAFFDWNETRVSTITELSEVMAALPDPPAAADRLKRVLQSVFESAYAFELEELRKLNLGPATERLRKIDGTTEFTVAYVVQASLGGHAIPVDAGVVRALYVVELVSEKDVASGVVPGLERAIAKSRGIEFASLLHQLGADFVANRFSPDLHKILLQINPEAKDRLPKRRAKRKPPEPTAAVHNDPQPQEAQKPKPRARRKPASQTEAVGKQGAASDRAATEAKGKSSRRKARREDQGESSTKKSSGKRQTADKTSSADETADPSESKSPSEKPKKEGSRKKSISSGISKRKPR